MKEIQLTQGKIARIDDADFESADRFKWHAAKSKRGFTHPARYEKRTADRLPLGFINS